MDEYRTPPELLDGVVFDLDAAATPENAVAARYITREQDALNPATEWPGRLIWLNPPYSHKAGPLYRWVERAWQEALKDKTVIMLLPADTSTLWFYDFLWNGHWWRPGVQGVFLRGRVRFITPDGTRAGAPKFGSLMVRLGPTRVLPPRTNLSPPD